MIVARLFISLLLLFFLTLPVRAQEFGGTPPRLKWRQLNSDTVRIIYRPGLDSIASGISRLIGEMAAQTQPSIGSRLRKINLVLHEQTTVANAYVALGPYRSEFLLTPQQNSFELGSLPWYQTLAIHEYRHVQQFNNFRVGLSKWMYYLAGELGQSLANSAAIPNWFWEGDAVYQETLISPQGRGRMPHFMDGYRSLWAAHKDYGWMKLRNGSLRDYVPDHYQLGYLLTAYGRQTYGDDFWRKVTGDAARYRGLFYPFQRAIKKYSGKSYPDFVRQALSFFSAQQPQSETGSIAEMAAAHPHFLGDEEFPQWIDSNRLIYTGGSYRKLPSFMIRDLHTGNTRSLRVRDISLDHYFSYRNGWIVYCAYQPDMRWGWREYSNIKMLNLNTGRQVSVTRKSRYFAPDISADGQRVLAVHAPVDGSSELQVLDAGTGAVLKTLAKHPGWWYTYPKFMANDQVVTAVRNEKGQMALVQLDRNGELLRQWTAFSYQVIGFVSVQGDSISFSAQQGNRDQVFLIVRDSLFRYDQPERNNITGNYQLAVWGDRVAFTSTSAVGQRISIDTASYLHLQVVSGLPASQPSLSPFGITVLESGHALTPLIKVENKEGKPYPRSRHLIHFHSWLPDINDPDYTLSLIGENVLNTLQQEIYFTYNQNERSKTAGFRATYGAWYPWMRLGGEYSFDRRADFDSFSVDYGSVEAYAGVGLPLNLTQGRYYRNLLVTADYAFSKPFPESAYKDRVNSDGYSYLRTNISFSNQVQQARQHIFPRWAQVIRVNAFAAATGRKGAQLMIAGNWYLPGIGGTHSIVMNTAAHWRDNRRETNFTNSFPFSRGYISRNFEQMYRLGFNYHFPVAYPDWGWADIVYILRIRLNAFYDYTRVRQPVTGAGIYDAAYRSYGLECYFDTKWWNQEPVSFGLRYARLVDAGRQGIDPNQFAFILPVNLFRR